MADEVVAQGVATAALTWFKASSLCQKKHPETQWTVLAAFVVHTKSQDAADRFRVLAAATGTKCLGRRDLNAHGLVVNDCHAEILARRAMLRYLYAELLGYEAGAVPPGESIFEPHAESGRLTLKRDCALHLFVSETPCGDASIYALRSELVDGLVEQRTQREAVVEGAPVERSDLRLTGAKIRRKRPRSASQGDEPNIEKRFEQVVGIARVKSGRSDLPLDKQTLSMSCSDKLAKWTALGIQGTLLLRWFEPILLTSIVVSADDASSSREAQLQAMRRALVTRLETVDRPVCCALAVVDLAFQRKRSSDKAASPLALNWSCSERHWRSSAPAEDADKSFVAKFFRAQDVEVLLAATGLKQGAKKASQLTPKAMEKVASRLAKHSFLRAFHLLSDPKTDVNAKAKPYQELKEAVLHTNAAIEQRRREFFDKALPNWVGVPPSYKQLTLELP